MISFETEEFTLDESEVVLVAFPTETRYWTADSTGSVTEGFGCRFPVTLVSPDLDLKDQFSNLGEVSVHLFKVSLLSGGWAQGWVARPKEATWGLFFRHKDVWKKELDLISSLRERKLEYLKGFGNGLGVRDLKDTVEGLAEQLAPVFILKELEEGIRDTYEKGGPHLLGIRWLGDSALGLAEEYGWYRGVQEGCLILEKLDGPQVRIEITDTLVVRKCVPSNR